MRRPVTVGSGTHLIAGRLDACWVMALAVTCCILTSTPAIAAESWTLSAAEARERAAGEGLTIIDIRRPDEWRRTGLPAVAAQATMRFGRGTADFLGRIRTLTDGNPNRPIALICAAGVRSAYAAKLLREQGYTRVYDISEGMLGSDAGPGWLASGLPTRSCDGC